MGRRFYSIYATDPAGRAALEGWIHPDLEEQRGGTPHHTPEQMYRALIGGSTWEGDELIVSIDDNDRLTVEGHAFPGDDTARPLEAWLVELRRIKLIPPPRPSAEHTTDTEYPICPHCGAPQCQWEFEDLPTTHWAYQDCEECGAEMALSAVVEVTYATRIPKKSKAARQMEKDARQAAIRRLIEERNTNG